MAELTFGLILALDRRIPDNVSDLRAGKWNKKEYANVRGLYGRRLSLLGFGSIGHEVARRAIAFGTGVAVWSRRFGSIVMVPRQPHGRQTISRSQSFNQRRRLPPARTC